MDSHTDTHSVSRLEVVDSGRRRRWPDEVKLRIVGESLSAPGLVSATARRHGISNQLLYLWRKAYREGRLGEGGLNGFVAARIVPEPPGTAADGRMEVVSANGRRVIVDRGVDVEALLAIIQGLEGLR